MITGIYVRVSTEEQVSEGYSIRAQEEKLRDFAKIKDWLVYKIYIDEGISGKNITERPAVNELIEDIKNHKINNVVVYKIDRLTRSIVDLIKFVDLFNEYDCSFNSLMESIDTQTAAGRMFLKIIGIFAEFERENIIERTKLGFERKVKEGYSLCTRTASYGYIKTAGNKLQQIDEAEAGIVNDVFRMFVQDNMSFLDIAKYLNMKQIPTKENAVWHARTIKNMLTNCNYIGKVRYATKDEKRGFETQGQHEPIVDEEIFQEAQDLISGMTKKQYTKRPKEEHYFLGVLHCGVCGGRMVTHGTYRNREFVSGAYRCSNKIKKTCNSPGISHRLVEKAFENYISNINDFDAVDEVNIGQKEHTKPHDIELLKAYKNKYEQLEIKENELATHYIHNEISFENYSSIKKALEAEKNAIAQELAKLDNERHEEREVKRADILQNLNVNWSLLTLTERRQFVLKFIDRIEIVNEKEHATNKKKVKILKIEFHSVKLL